MGWTRRLPRSFWPLIAAAVLALALLWWLSRQGRDAPTAGLLVPWDPQSIVGVELVRADGRFLLTRAQGEWRLGGAVTDWVAPEAVAEFLRGMTLGTAGATVPGSESRDRRYGFGGPEAVSLVVSAAGDRRLVVDFGAVNPVSGLRYASSNSRPGVFAVTDPYRSLLARMPDLVRLKTLLPPLAPGDVDTIRIERGGAAPLLLVRRGKDWWLRAPAVGLDSFATEVRRYHTLYEDRSRRESGVRWLRASRRRLSNLIYEVSATAVVGFGPPAPTAAYLRENGLAPPYRAVTLRVQGFAEPLRVQFGEVDQAAGRVPALRQAAAVVTHATALRTAELPNSEFVDLGALGFTLADADSYCVAAARGEPLVCARRTGDDRWQAVAPPGFRVRSPGEQADNLVGDLVIDLDRLAIERVLPPAKWLSGLGDLATLDDPAPLRAEPLSVLTAWFDVGPPRRLLFGRLATAWPPPAAGGDAARPAAPQTPIVCDPADGKLLVIGEQPLISFRALRDFLVPDSPR